MNQNIKSRNLWAAEKRMYERTYRSILNKRTQIIDIPKESEDLGFTSQDGNIHLAEEHKILEGLSMMKKSVFRKGVFTHEMLHQVFTNFRYTTKLCRRLPRREQQIFMTICNILEDPAIEYFAPSVVGGTYIKALNYSIYHIYNQGPNIEDVQGAFGQFITAYIQIGDIGVLKGHFTEEKAKEIFDLTSDLFIQGIEEPSNCKRIDIAKEIFELSRPLWEEEIQQQEIFEQFMNDLMDLLEDLGKNESQGHGNGQDGDNENTSSSSKSQKRKQTIKKVSKEEFDQLKKEAEENGTKANSLTDADEIIVCDENEGEQEGQTGSASSSEDEKDSDSSLGLDQDSKSEDTSNNKKEEKSKPSLNSNESGKTMRSKHPETLDMRKNKEVSDVDSMTESVKDIKSEYDLTDEDLARCLTELQSEEKKVIKEEQQNQIEDVQDFDVSGKHLDAYVSCDNIKVNIPNQIYATDTYNQVIQPMNVGIKTVTNQLRRVILNELEEKVWKSSGKLDFKRLRSGKVTSKVFTKRKEESDHSDLVIEVLIDESGSMGGEKSVAARNSAIVLAEIFSNLNIPCYIMGFTEGINVEHFHYVTWNHNELQDRLKLLNITARTSNFDGYSIRYGGQNIKKQNAEHKIMIVISDGQPCSTMCSGMSAVEDTKNAVKEVRKFADVIGIAVGNDDTDIIHYMYGNNFMHIGDVNDLFTGLTKVIKKTIQSWD